MTCDQAALTVGGPIGEEAMEQAKELERLVQRMAIAEQQVFTREVALFGLTVPQFVTLAAVEASSEEEASMGAIAGMVHQCSATMTGIIDRLEGMGLARRRANPKDRRSFLVELTDAGEEKLEAVRAVRRRRLAYVLSGIGLDMRLRVYEVLLQYTQALETYPAD